MQSQREKSTQAARRRAFGRFDAKRESASGGWTPLELGGHEVVSRLELDLDPGPAAAAMARSSLDRLRGHMQDSVLDVIRLLVTELVTNSVRHGRNGSEPSPVRLEIDVFTNAVRVEVADHGEGFDLDEPPRPHEDRPGGWGLCLVDRLSDRWGVERRDGTCVWFELERSDNRWDVAS